MFDVVSREFTTVSREVRPCPERYDSGFGIRDSGGNPIIEAPSRTMFLAVCFIEWDCFGVQIISF